MRGRPGHSGRRSGSSAAPARIRWTILRISAGSLASCVPPSPTIGFTPPTASCWAGASRRLRRGSCSRAVAVLRRPSPTRRRAGTNCASASPAFRLSRTQGMGRTGSGRRTCSSSTSRAFRTPIAIPPRRCARIAEHGANSPLVRDWVIGQDAVLLNCYADSSLPEELPPNAPAWLKADLAYQIAAAYFYRLDYTRAGQLFAEIGRDASSPWQKTARYLVARCAVHAAIEDKTPKLIADAQQAIDALATDPQLADYRADAPKLASLLAFATRPQEQARELERALLAPDLPNALPVDLRDFLLLERTGTRATDLGAWIYDIDVLTAS